MNKCEKCGGVLRVKYTYRKGEIRKRVYRCDSCGEAYASTEKFDKKPTLKPHADKVENDAI